MILLATDGIYIHIHFQSAIHVLELINKLLPVVTTINLYSANKLDVMHKELSDKVDGPKPLGKLKLSKTEIRDSKCMTTSQHYAWVESDHPYKAATVSNYKYISIYYY